MHHLSLRDVQRLAKENNLGVELSSGYLSLLERSEVREPSPRILHALASIYEIDYIDLMRRANYLPDDEVLSSGAQRSVVFRGATHLTEEQHRRIQHLIDFELNQNRRSRRQQDIEGVNE